VRRLRLSRLSIRFVVTPFILTALIYGRCAPTLRPELLANLRQGTAHANITTPVSNTADR
jgi:hypothetical protein